MVGADATVTVTRNPRLLPTETESGPQHLTSPDGLVEPGPPDSRGARSVALVGCAVVLAAVGIVFFALTRPPSESAVDTSPSAEDTGESLAANDSFFSTPRVPEDVTVNVSPNGRAAEVSWASVEGAAAYQVERLDTDAVSEVVETATSLEFDDGDRPCVAVRAIGIDGKMSAASSAVCATP